ncbi:hypothetical protein [Methylobacterium sp. J-076]|uniref:hypothetical protein n=1 Tax=Methylobacterium sp. J-076 TaxID=2836655 RepID=UPI001FBA3254|nr:hypothetical protein [Methylobacterium sp. J-076]MCJ2011748.1 hypothetical protein [Methylobacterium sp. J-076]
MTTTQEASGTIWAVFGHRLAIEGDGGRILADLGPTGAEGIAIAVGDTVSLKGERKPSEIKVTSLTLGDGVTREIAWPKKPHGDDEADEAKAVAAVKAEGYAIEGEPARKPKHFEIVGAKEGARHELHVAFDGTIRKAKPLTA